jgi:hypothetical protein
MMTPFAALALAAFAGQTPPIGELLYSADVGANIVGGGEYAARRDYVADAGGARSRVAIPGLPETVDLRDFQRDANGHLLFALDVGTTLGGVYFDPGDVVELADGGVYSKAFDAAAAGVPKGVHCDGVARDGANGALLLSFDRTFAAAGVTIRPADVVRYAAGAFGAKVLDAAALALDDRLNVDAIDSIGTTTDLLVSFDTGGQAGGVTFADEDVLQFHYAGAGWSLRFALLQSSDRWAAANLDGLATLGDDLFKNGFE